MSLDDFRRALQAFEPDPEDVVVVIMTRTALDRAQAALEQAANGAAIIGGPWVPGRSRLHGIDIMIDEAVAIFEPGTWLSVPRRLHMAFREQLAAGLAPARALAAAQSAG